MLGPDVALGVLAQVRAAAQAAGQAQKAGVLARAVVVERVRLDPRGSQLALHRLAGGPLRSTLERAQVEPGPGEHAFDDRGVRRFAVVRSAGDRELLVAQAALV